MTVAHIVARKCRTAALIALVVSLLPAAFGDDNPYRTTKVGDWVEYKMTGPNMEGKTRMTVVAKDDKELTYEIASTFTYAGNQMVGPTQTQKIDLTKSYDPVMAENLKAKGATVVKEGEGKEKLKLGEKEFDTHWTRSKTTNTVNGVTVVTDAKMWFSKDVPLSGLVRMEQTTAGLTTKLDLIGSGKK